MAPRPLTPRPGPIPVPGAPAPDPARSHARDDPAARASPGQPGTGRGSGRSAPASASDGLAGKLAVVLAEVLEVDTVGADRHFFDDLGADSMVMAQFCARVRKQADLPNVSIKDVYQHSTIAALASALAPAAATAVAAPRLPRPPVGLAAQLAAVLAEVLKVDQVAADRHFFDDLGADSMVMAQFCARLRKRADLPNVSIKDVYRHSTIRALAGALAAPGDAAVPSAEATQPSARAPAGRSPRRTAGAADAAPMSRSKPRFFLCGPLQLLAFLGVLVLAVLILVNGFEWISASPTLLDIYLRSVTFGGATFLGACLLPILAKWMLIGRWKPRQIPVWSLDYFRFWLVKTLIRTNPLVRFAGTPLYLLYLRALGAKIGRGVTILSPTVPVCTDLLTIGAGTVIRKDSSFTGYRAHNGVIQIGPVTLGRDVYIGETTVLDIGTAMGDGAQLGHSSSLHTGQVVPAGATLARLAGRADRPSTTGWSAPPGAASCGGSCCRCCSCSSCSR